MAPKVNEKNFLTYMFGPSDPLPETHTENKSAIEKRNTQNDVMAESVESAAV
ncbi:hypothetical protein [Marinicella sp. W31]|uniref:hypothetical protein n=1 Tax=Marinicella sp. W31 TaxID=3023713 RepID=UPI00375758CB